MKFNFHDYTQDEQLMISSAAVKAMGHLEISPKVAESLEIELTINGVEINFLAFTKQFSNQISRIAREMAKEMIGKITDDVRSVIYDKLDEMEQDVDKVVEEKL